MRLPARTAAVGLCALLSASALGAAAPRADEALKAEVSSIVDLFYGHDFEKAAPAAAALEARHPGHPVGPLFEAVVAFQRWTAEGLKDDRSWEAVDHDLARAIGEAEAMEKTSPAESNYYMGAALGFRARGLAARKSFLRAVPAAASSLRHLKKALELDPTLEDARLGLGMYHYFAARMPPAARPFARVLMGESGDREKGLAELWSVANSSGVARMEARAVLSMILSKNDEADWAGAEKLLAELMGRYPRNPIYRLRRVYVAEKRGNWDQAAALADPDGTWIAALHPGLRDNARAWAAYRAAECDLMRGRPDAAARRLAPLDEKKAPKGLRDWIVRRRAELASPPPGGYKDVAPFFSGY
jgi:hypothetical protein